MHCVLLVLMSQSWLICWKAQLIILNWLWVGFINMPLQQKLNRQLNAFWLMPISFGKSFQ